MGALIITSNWVCPQLVSFLLTSPNHSSFCIQGLKGMWGGHFLDVKITRKCYWSLGDWAKDANNFKCTRESHTKNLPVQDATSTSIKKHYMIYGRNHHNTIKYPLIKNKIKKEREPRIKGKCRSFICIWRHKLLILISEIINASNWGKKKTKLRVKGIHM